VKHRHLSYPTDLPAEKWPVAALVDVLERGDLGDWKPIAVAVARDPHGRLAARVLKIVNTHPMYGTSPLWREWIAMRRRRTRKRRTPKPETRRRQR
jgi:hypothetical protein